MKKPIPFGKYFLMDRVAVGGMAEVFKGKMFGVKSFERIVALKRILPNIAEDQEFITMFIDEAKIAVQLSHPNIAQIFELGEVEGTYFIAMEYVQGRDLRTIFDRARRQKAPPISPQMAAYVMAKACEGLDYAHRKRDKTDQPLNIVHRDVSPQNVLVSYDGDVKIIDFGVAKAQSKSTRTQAGILKGKFGYMSPEQVQGLPLDQRSDVFSIGIVLHEILTGQRLFVGESDFHTLEKIRKAEAVPPSRLNPQVPQQLDAIVMKALARDLHIRYQYASEMQEDLQRFLYMMNPVYSRRDLNTYMHHAFDADISREKQRAAEYDHFFTMMHQQGALQPPVQTPTGHWTGAPPENFSSSGSYSGSHPTGHQSGVVMPEPVFASTSSSFVGQTPGGPTGYLQEMDSTMLDPNRARPSGMAPSGAPGSPFGGPSGGYLTGDSFQGPSPTPPVAAGGGEDEGAATIIDMDFNSDLDAEKQSSGKKALILTIASALLVCTLGIVAFFMFFKPSNNIDPLPVEPARITLIFSGPLAKEARFFIDQEEIAAEQIKRNPNNRVVIEFKKAVRGKLRVLASGFQDYERSFQISPGGELMQPIQLRPKWSYIEIESDPPQATVIIDGKAQPQPTPGKYQLVAGEKRKIEVAKQGYTVWQEIMVPKGNTTVKRVAKMKRTRASITVTCKPNKEGAFAKVFLGRRLKGKTPLTIGKLSPTKTYKIKAVPNKYDKAFEQEVSFPLHPNIQLQVDCTKPILNGAIKIQSRPNAIIQIDGKNYGVTPKQITLKPGTYEIFLTNSKTQKRIGPYRYTVKAGLMNNIQVLEKHWGN
ncbi:MAG: serine/threonine protein kinase [Myxococcales bacterium]|nr:serine/threonine protein kinase [Myxococcales bacterium]